MISVDKDSSSLIINTGIYEDGNFITDSFMKTVKLSTEKMASADVSSVKNIVLDNVCKNSLSMLDTAAVVWLVGMIVVFGYLVFSYFCL